MVNKYIIDKTDIHDLLTGKEIPLPQGKARAFCVEVAGKITNGDMIKAMFPNIKINDIDCLKIIYTGIEHKNMIGFNIDATKDWWNAPYKTESEG